MICVVEGPPGSGKSYSSVRRIAAALDRGKPVATNVQLTEGWQLRLAKANWIRRLIPGRVRHTAKAYDRLIHMSGDLDELLSVRLEGRGEGRGVMVLDEAHTWCNARTWKDSDRLKLVRFFSAHRHLGWDVFLITQRAENIDAQIRSLAEYRIVLRNLRRMRIMGIPILPVNLFLAIWSWEGGIGAIIKRECYRLNGLAKLYETLALAGAADLQPERPIYLPRRTESEPRTDAPRSGPSAQSPSPPAESSQTPAPVGVPSEPVPSLRAVTPPENAKRPELDPPSVSATERALPASNDSPAA